MRRSADAVVIGAGVIGCSVAHALAGSGRSVLVVDRNRGPGQGSTSASSAIIRFNYSTLAGVATAWEAHWSWLDWEGFLGGSDEDGSLARFWRTGSLCLDAPAHDPSKVLRLFDQVGVPYEVLTAQEIRHAYPWLDPARHYPPKPVDSDAFWDEPSGEIGGYATPDAGFVDDPSFAAHNLATAARRRGVQFLFRVTVVGIRRRDGRVSGVELSDGTVVHTPVAVNVSGPSSGQLNDLAGVSEDFEVRTRPLRVETHAVPAPPGFTIDGQPGPMIADIDLGTYFRGTPSGQLLVGGAEPECDPLEWLDDPDDYAPSVTRSAYEAQVYRVARRLPTLGVPSVPRGIAAVYDVADDWIPIYDKTALPGYYVAIGTSGNQFKNAPLVGSYLRAIIDTCEQGVDHDETPAHFFLPHTGLNLDLSAYSRRRQPSPDSSNTVMG
ncbi:MAG: FAD-dependent oxidoreductase [Jatrophihabitans sp.]